MDNASLARGGLWLTAGRIVAVVARFLVGLTVARLLGPEGRGQYALLVLVPTILVQFLNLGLGQANTFFLGRRRAPAGPIAANSLLLGGIGGTVAVAVLLAVWKAWQPSFLPDISLPALALSCMAVPFALVHFFASFALLGLGQIRRFGALLFIEGASQLGYLAVFLILADWGLLGAILAWSLTTMTCASVAVVWFVRPILASLRPDKSVLKDTLSYGLRIYPAAIMQYLNLRFDQFLVESLAGAVPLGLYAAAVSMTEAAWQMPIALSMVLFSRVSTTTDRQADVTTPRVLRATVAIAILECALLWLLGRYLIRSLFGSPFEAALPALIGLLPGTVFYAAGRILEGDLTGRGHPLIPSLAAGAALATTIGLDLFWIPRRGIEGAAWASSIAYALNALVLLVAFVRITGMGWLHLWRSHDQVIQ